MDDSHITSKGLPQSYAWNNFWSRGERSTGVVYAEAIPSTTHFGGISGTRETAVGGLRFCTTVDDEITAVTFLVPLEASVVVILTVAEVDTTFNGHARGIDIRGPRESPALNVIPTHEQ